MSADTLRITVELPSKVVEEAAAAAWNRLFAAPSYESRKGGEAYEVVADRIRQQAQIAAAEIPLRTMVQEAVAAALPGILEREVGAALSALVKAEVKRQRESGQLALAARQSFATPGEDRPGSHEEPR